jgi:hypothetical protein
VAYNTRWGMSLEQRFKTFYVPRTPYQNNTRNI